ncbi:MAG: cytochrome C oxidase subunit IV family protein [candidate division Zixibacteria bacterium]|nr:cytochrome C oxidase subunit IV family protein [candidate division Zixibacteria bacterium]
MSGAEAHDIPKQVRGYIGVFIALAALTALTVFAAHLEVPKTAHILIALFIAVVKGSLVASYFMHLISEKKLIYSTLILTAVFFAVLMFFPLSAMLNQRAL